MHGIRRTNTTSRLYVITEMISKYSIGFCATHMIRQLVSVRDGAKGAFGNNVADGDLDGCHGFLSGQASSTSNVLERLRTDRLIVSW